MATGGLALLLSAEVQPHPFNGLETIAKIVFLFDIAIFLLITLGLLYRFTAHPGSLSTSLSHPTESLFFGAFLLSSASIIGSIGYYGIPSCGPWLIVVYRVLFWIYYAAAFSLFVGQYYLFFSNARLRAEDLTPAWDLPILPTMLTGTIASIGASTQHPHQAIPIIVAGVTAQGVGMMVSMLMLSNYCLRMIQYGLPSPQSRPGMFIAVGPPAFTSLALISLANAWPVSRDFAGSELIAAQVFRILATFSAIFMWSLGLWFCAISAIACIAVWKELSFHLNWWGFVFPNVGFTISVIMIGKELHSEGILWVGNVMTILLVGLYLFVGVQHVRAVVGNGIMYPGKDEDVYRGQQRKKLDEREKEGTGLV
jgi:C4-dicarboxylate transporter/malic acid transport protein